jgi:type I restriction enzyme, S subunit
MKSPLNAHWKVPQDWKIVAIQDVTSDWRGGAPFEPDDFTAEGFPVLHKGGIQRRGKITIDARKKTFTTEEYAKSHQKSVIDRSYMAATLRDLVPSGPSIGLMADLSLSPSDKYILAQGAYGFKLDADVVDSAYLVLLSNYEPFREYIKRYCVGSTQIHIRTPVFQELKIPLPPIETQKRIAAILDQAEALRSLRRQSIGQLDALARSVFLEMFGDPAKGKQGWDIKELQQVVKTGTIVTYGIVQAGEEFPEGVPYIRTGDINNGSITVNGLRHTDPAIAAKFERSRVDAGDIVMSIRATVGTTALVPESLHGANLTQGTAKIAPGENVERLYLLNFLRMDETQHWISRQVKGATFREITLTRLRELPVVIPPLALQQEFADRIGAIEALKATHRESLTKLDELFSSLQHRAFRGEL